MPELRESVVLAILVTVLISIPAASQTVNIHEGEDFGGSIDSKFSDIFKVDFKPGEMLMELKDSEYKLEINQSYRKRVVKLQGSHGFIRKTVSNESIVKVVQTPYGKFESGVRNGENFSDFEGGDEEKAEEIKDNLESVLDERLVEAREKRRVVVSRIMPDIELDVETDNSIEHFNLTNNGEEEINMEGWTVVTEGGEGDSMQLERSIEPGEKLAFYSGDRDDIEGAEDAIYGTGLTIYSDEGSVTLHNENERVVDTYEY